MGLLLLLLLSLVLVAAETKYKCVKDQYSGFTCIASEEGTFSLPDCDQARLSNCLSDPTLKAEELLENGAQLHSVERPYTIVDACDYQVADFNKRNHLRVHCSNIPKPEEDLSYFIDAEYTPDIASQGKMMFKPVPTDSNFNSIGVQWGMYMEEDPSRPGYVRTIVAFSLSQENVEAVLLDTFKGGVELSRQSCNMRLHQEESKCKELRKQPLSMGPTPSPTPEPTASPTSPPTPIATTWVFKTGSPTAEPTTAPTTDDADHETASPITLCRYSRDALDVGATALVLCSNTEHEEAQGEYIHLSGKGSAQYFASTESESKWKLVMVFGRDQGPTSVGVFEGTVLEYEEGRAEVSPVTTDACSVSDCVPGTKSKKRAAKVPDADAGAQEVCVNHPTNWTDTTGHDCVNYETFDWCPDTSRAVSALSTDAVGAAKACCACGGGKRVAASGASASKVWQPLEWTAAMEVAQSNKETKANDNGGMFALAINRPHPGCVDTADWRSAGDATCKKYEVLSWCTRDGRVGLGWQAGRDGSISEWADENGDDAFDACCACGGGLLAPGDGEGNADGGDADLLVAIGGVAVAADQQERCEDTQGFETDIHGAGVGLTCAAFAENDWCGTGAGWDPLWGEVNEYYDTNAADGAGGMSAIEACCVCGGGRMVGGMSTATQRAQHDGEHEQQVSVLTLRNKIMISAACATLLVLAVALVVARRSGVGMSLASGINSQAHISSADGGGRAVTTWNDSILTRLSVGSNASATSTPEAISPASAAGSSAPSRWMNVSAPRLPFATPHPASSIAMGRNSGGAGGGVVGGGRGKGSRRGRGDIGATGTAMGARGPSSALVRADNDIISIL